MRRWCAAVVVLSVLILTACALIVWRVDPFEHYRESAILPLYDNESYNNPGIARNYDYDAVILGTSMVEMSHPSVIDECFGVHSVKLPMRGSVTAQMGWQLEHVLEKRELKTVILAVDAYSLVGDPDDTTELYDYLWNDDPLDDVRYLLNLDVLIVEIPRTLRNAGKPLTTKRDDMFQWVDVSFSKADVLAVTPPKAQSEILPEDTRLERSTENLERHIRRLIEQHPETRFLIYTPPYSAAYWYNVLRQGQMEQQFRSRRRICELLGDLSNVEIYDFSSRIEWIEDLDQYFDFSHHSSEISDRIIRAMASGDGRVYTADDMQSGSEKIREAARRIIPVIEGSR